MLTFNNFKGHNLGNVANPRELCTFKDCSKIEFNRGNFDDYRVTYYPDGKNTIGYSPEDNDYFTDLRDLQNYIDKNNVWEDFKIISDEVIRNGFNHNGKPVYDNMEVQRIRGILIPRVKIYPQEIQLDVYKLFITIWAVMISEWYHEYGNRPSILKHTPKILGAYQVFYDDYEPSKAAEFSKYIERVDAFIRQKEPDFDLNIAKNRKLKKVMDIYGIDYSWLP